MSIRPLLGLVILGAATLAVAQPRSDSTRAQRVLDTDLVFVPSPEGVRAASSGFEEVAADLMWVRAVLLFGERFSEAEDAAWVDWLARMIDTITALDPRWSTPYHYGSGMLRVLGQVDASSALLERCTDERPEDHWCPMSRGMNDLLFVHDPAAAAVWMKRAAERASAPRWYAAAAAAMLSDAGQRRAGLAYLDEQLAEAADPAVVADLQAQRAKLVHDEVVATWAKDCVAFYDREGVPLGSPDALAGLGHALPANPRGDAWVVGADGVVRSQGAEHERRRDAERAEWKLIRRR